MAEGRVHLFVTGRVQGVSFRWHTREYAQRFDLAGWVRNLPDGRVEVMAEGDEDGLRALVEWVHIGSPKAIVDDVNGQWMPVVGDLERPFEIVSTANADGDGSR